jgi:trehalose-6-phosphatase
VDKGSAVRTLVAEAVGRCGRTPLPLYAGDDVTDEAAFAELEDGVTILVGEERPTRAAYRVDGPDDLLGLLLDVEKARKERQGPRA